MRRPSPSMIVALVALCLSMTGAGYAAAKITGADVKNNSLTGRDIRESKLGTVPSAATVDGQSVGKISFESRPGNNTTTVFNGGGLKISAQCTTQVGLTLEATIDGFIYSQLRTEGNPGELYQGRSTGGASTYDLLLDDATPSPQYGDRAFIEFTYKGSNGVVATGTIRTDEVPSPQICRAYGNVTYG